MEDFRDPYMDAKCDEYKDDRIVFLPTKFEDVRTGKITYGIHYRDEWSVWSYSTYHWDSIPDDDLEFLELVIENDRELGVQHIICSIVENHRSIMIGNILYDWNKIKHIFKNL